MLAGDVNIVKPTRLSEARSFLVFQLDRFRIVPDNLYTPPRAAGALTFLAVLGGYIAFVLFSISAYISQRNMPDVVTTSVVPSISIADNIIDHFEWGTAQASVKTAATYVTGVTTPDNTCVEGASSAFTAGAGARDWSSGGNSVRPPPPLCPAQGISVPCDNRGYYPPLYLPMGFAFVVDGYKRMTNYVPGATSNAYNPVLFTVTVDGIQYPETVAEALPDYSVQFPISVVTYSFKHFQGRDGVKTVSIIGRTVSFFTPPSTSGPPTLEAVDVSSSSTGSCLPNFEGPTSVPGSVAFMDASGAPVTLSSTSAVIVLQASETTVVEVVHSNQPSITQLLGSIGGAFGLIMTAAGYVLKALDWIKNRLTGSGTPAKVPVAAPAPVATVKSWVPNPISRNGATEVTQADDSL